MPKTSHDIQSQSQVSEGELRSIRSEEQILAHFGKRQQLKGLLTLLGVDGATHMAEEIEDASIVIPRALIITVLINGAIGWAALVVVFFCMGSIDGIMEMSGGVAFVSMFYSVTQSVPGASALVSMPTGSRAPPRQVLIVPS
ncbi:uncharacterized protein N0V89_011997 [Didymosphaeria variabile]|uniref:Uncharacterized protein n=1 Tax=Didymosphaeria variabile TaxID=1932322 RepID=A0A9W8XAR5_9PLEO|nr:uncharacterized protein N0V89_011997 [Didymosphaeria variabile]KAJ4345862.1 hypothetical protein N0V89_011997 [Didymosphaeria variabile]